MRSKRDLRLKRGAARAMDRRTGAQSHEGLRSSRLVLHSGSTTGGEEVNDQAAIPIKLFQKRSSNPPARVLLDLPRRRLVLVLLRSLLLTLRNMFLALLMRFWRGWGLSIIFLMWWDWGLRPWMSDLIMFIMVRLLFTLRPSVLDFAFRFIRSFGKFFTLYMWHRYSWTPMFTDFSLPGLFFIISLVWGSLRSLSWGIFTP